MDIVQRIKNIVLQPKSEWPVIESEPASAASLYTQYLIPLAAVGTVARLLGMTLMGVSVPFIGRIRVPLTSALTSSIIGFVAMLLGVYLWAMIVNALAPRFGGQKNMLAALKVVIYAATPALVAGIFGLLPSLFFLQLLAGLYGLYLLYLGFPVLMKVSPDRAGTYTAATVASGIVMGLVFGALSATLNLGVASRTATSAQSEKAAQDMVAGILGAATGGTEESKAAAATALAGVVAAGQQAEEAERAAKSTGAAALSNGSDSATVAQSGEAMGAAAAMLGTMMSGGKEQVELVDFRVLKDLLPNSGGKLRRTDATGQTTTAGRLSGSNAEGSYSVDNGGSATVKISDMGNARGLIAMGKMAFSVESESDRGFEKNVQLNGQRVHVKWNGPSKSAELMAFVGDRFAVEVTSHGTDMGVAEKLFASIDLQKLASRK